MAFRKITNDELGKLQSINAVNRKMAPETREDLEAFKALTLDSQEDILLMPVPEGKDRTKVKASLLTKFKTYLTKDEFAQVDLFPPTEDHTILILRKRTPKTN